MYELLNAFLENGLQVILHKIPQSRTVSCGLWVKQGSCNENDETSGFSHLIEHLVIHKEMKGKTNLEKRFTDISNNGVIYNASTSKESTSYFFSGLNSQLPKCLELLSKMVKEEREISEEAFNREKKVVAQEAISFYSSFNQIRERSSQALWGDTSIGRPILGKIDNIEKAQRKTLQDIIRNVYVPSNALLVIVGGIDYDDTLDMVADCFSEWTDKEVIKEVESVNHDAGIFFNDSKKTQSSVFSLCFRIPSYNNDERICMNIMSKIVGDSGLSSRMMTKIRGENGLAYQTGSFISFYEDCGTFGLNTLCKHENVNQIITLLNEEFINILKQGFTHEEMQRSKNMLETQTLLNLDDVQAQMKYIAKNALYGNMFSLENELRMIQRTSLDALNHSIRRIIDDKNVGFAGIGNFDIDSAVNTICFEGR